MAEEITPAFLAAADALAADSQRRERLGTSARTYAERHFDIEAITDRFDAVLTGPSSPSPPLSALHARPSPQR